MHADVTLNKVYREYYPYLASIGRKQGFDAETVKDVINQTFLVLLEKQVELSAIYNLKSFLATTFRRKLIDLYRSGRVQQKRLHGFAETAVQPSVESVLIEDQAFAELKLQLKTAYEKLPRRCKMVIFLKFYEGLDNAQIAERTGLSIRSVYNNLSLAIRLLRGDMQVSRNDTRTLLLLLPLLFF
ncbi:sigma-70 family RNA polymerase sigma factor [Compostibacter hankyongensis]|uniref:RNA polymerase sigma factor 70 region 4 type 2 domain-containing protein n=1 Tax=Compostibacter hankyongensis TaxID=1007089 RepID=A0ABP8FVY8_9BACT